MIIILFLHFREGKIRIKKEPKVENYMPAKVAEYDTTVWAEATLQFEDWKEWFHTDKPLQQLVYGRMYFVSSIWSKNGIRYSGIHKLNDNSEIISGTGLNLDNYEWNNIMRKVDDINIALYGSQAMKGEKRSSPENEVLVWSASWYLNGEEVETLPYKMEFFSEEDAKSFGETSRPKKKLNRGEKLEMKVSSIYRKRPEETTQMKMALVELAIGAINWCKYKACEACQLDPPAQGQRPHMKSGGCMDEEGDAILDYLGDVWGEILVEDLVAVYNTVCRSLSIPPQGSVFLAKAALQWIAYDDVANILRKSQEMGSNDDEASEKVLMHVNVPLRGMVRQAVINLGMPEVVGKKAYAAITGTTY